MSQDVIAVLGADLKQVFERAQTLKLTVLPSSKLMEHPLENGATIVDHRVILPVEAELSLMLVSADYPTVYKEVEDLFLRGVLLTVQTRVTSLSNMIIGKMPHDESADVYDGVTLALSLKEAQFVQPQFSTFKVARPKDASTVKRGQQQPTETPPARKSSVLSEWFK